MNVYEQPNLESFPAYILVKNRIDFTKRQFSKKLANMHALVVALFFRLSTNI